MRIDKISHGCRFPSERLSSSDQAKEIVNEMTAKGKEAMSKALCVSIRHIMLLSFPG